MLFSNPLALLCQKAALDGLAEFPHSRGDTGSVLKKTDEKERSCAVAEQFCATGKFSVVERKRSFLAQEKKSYIHSSPRLGFQFGSTWCKKLGSLWFAV